MSILSQPTISLQKIKSDEKWSFKELSRKDTRYITHGYHRYPAKFIPQLAAKLISGYSAENDLIVDPFLGSGTTLVEAKVLKRRSTVKLIRRNLSRNTGLRLLLSNPGMP